VLVLSDIARELANDLYRYHATPSKAAQDIERALADTVRRTLGIVEQNIQAQANAHQSEDPDYDCGWRDALKQSAASVRDIREQIW
jgi:hypothetical protein